MEKIGVASDRRDLEGTRLLCHCGCWCVSEV